jgi:type I restriction enzyme S subunit
MNSGGTPPMQLQEYWGGDIPFISAASMHDSFVSKSDQYITQEGLQNGSRLLKKGNLLILVRGSMLWNRIPVCYNTVDVAFNQDVKGLITNDKASTLFMFYWLQSKESILKYKVTGTSIGAGKLDSDDILDLLVIMPQNAEQSKIQRLFTLIDHRIGTQNKIITQLETLMKGIREQLFNQQIRFKDDNGKNFPHWEEKKLGQIAKITTGSSNREDSILDGEYVFFDRSQDIRTSNRYLFDAEAIIVPGEGQEFIPKYFVGKFDLHQRTYAIFDFMGINGKYLYYHIVQEDKHLQSQAVGSTVKSLRLPMFQSMPIKLPNYKEQTRITNFLSCIDEKIEIEKKILQQYERQKKHLLQNMFI